MSFHVRKKGRILRFIYICVCVCVMFPCMRFSLQDNASVGSFSKLGHLTLAAQNLLPTPINLWKRKVVKDPVRRRCQNERSLSKLNTIWTLNRSGFWWDEYFRLIWGDVDVVTNCQRRLRLSSQIVGKSRIIRAILTTKHWFPPSVNPSSLIAMSGKRFSYSSLSKIKNQLVEVYVHDIHLLPRGSVLAGSGVDVGLGLPTTFVAAGLWIWSTMSMRLGSWVWLGS